MLRYPWKMTQNMGYIKPAIKKTDNRNWLHILGTGFEFWPHTDLPEWSCSVPYRSLLCGRRGWRELRQNRKTPLLPNASVKFHSDWLTINLIRACRSGVVLSRIGLSCAGGEDAGSSAINERPLMLYRSEVWQATRQFCYWARLSNFIVTS